MGTWSPISGQSLYDPTGIWNIDYTKSNVGPTVGNNAGGNFMLNYPGGNDSGVYGPQNINNNIGGNLLFQGINNQNDGSQGVYGPQNLNVNDTDNGLLQIPGINNQVNPTTPFSTTYDNNPFFSGDSIIGSNAGLTGYNQDFFNNLNLPQYVKGDHLYGSGDPLGGAGGAQDAFGNASMGNFGYTITNPFTGQPITIGKDAQFDYGDFGRDNYTMGWGNFNNPINTGDSDDGGDGGVTVTASPGGTDDGADDGSSDITGLGGTPDKKWKFDWGAFAKSLGNIGKGTQSYQYDLFGSGGNRV